MTRPPASDPASPADRWSARAGIAAMLLLPPICGEYLAGYDDSTGRPLALLGGLLIFVPLYGAPALLMREVARRRGTGWPGILALAAAAGLLQAGVIDQSLFSESYRGADHWAAWRAATAIPGLGLSLHMLLAFVGGHVAWTFAAPIALAEAIGPAPRTDPWVGWRGLTLALLAYAGAAALVLVDHLSTQASHASPAQIAGTLVVATALTAWAVRRPARPPMVVRHSAPRPLPAGAIAFVVATAVTVGSETWLATLFALVAIGGAAAWLLPASRASAWTDRHGIALAAGVLLSRALLAFTYDPIFGEVEAWRKYGHNLAMLALVGGLTAWAWRRARPRPALR